MPKSIKVTISVLTALCIVLTLIVLRPVRIEVLTSAPSESSESFGSEVFREFVADGSHWVGASFATKVATSSPNRTYLEIANLSGATSTAQTVYCTTVIGQSATNVSQADSLSPYTGFAIFASTTKVFSRETGVPTGAIYCVAPTSSSTVSVVDY